MWIRALPKHFLRLGLTILLGGLLGATLVRFAPGFGADERELDSRLSTQSIQVLRESHASQRNILGYYRGYLGGLLRGDLGISTSLERPVAELFAQRLPVTLRSVGMGVAGGWLLGFFLALPAGMFRWRNYEFLTASLSGLFLCLPAAVLGLAIVYAGGPAWVAIALVVFPRVFQYARNIFVQSSELPHVLAAHARGLRGVHIFIWHVLPNAAPLLLALGGISVSMAFGAAIPIEAISDHPGIGQLTWQAALSRDLPVLVNITLLITVITLAANSVSDLAGRALARQRP
jgi:peptide/nickel transport system permease protein